MCIRDRPYNANVHNINANNNNNNNKNNYENKSVQQLTRPSTSNERGGECSTTREKKNEWRQGRSRTPAQTGFKSDSYTNKTPVRTGLLNDLHTQELRATLNDTNNPQQEITVSKTYCPISVSYTHLDVYKRQMLYFV